MQLQRSSGILLHPSSLPSPGGIGDFGDGAYAFINFLNQARQTLWQVLPLGPVGYGNSPYSCTSAFAGNPLLISLERLAEKGWIAKERLAAAQPIQRVDYDAVSAYKLPLLREAAANFLQKAEGASRERYVTFCRQNSWWLDDYVLFSALRERYHNESWHKWPRQLALREPGALNTARKEMSRELELQHAIQFAFIEQWRAIRLACAQRGIKIIGDVAIFVSYDSADVWTHPDIFHLTPDRIPYVVSGVPPDSFSKTGQRWGNPLYRWEVLRARGYDWWIQRMRAALEVADIVRLDHFRGFEKYWEIPAQEATAVNGRWVDGPKDELFGALAAALGKLPFIAEDLGFITPEVHALRHRLQVPGMRVMQFGFGDPGAEGYLPHRYERDCVAYSGTHDNDTTVGWWRHHATEQERTYAWKYLEPVRDAGVKPDGTGIAGAFIRALEGSVADLVVIPMQDVLGLDSDGRMNTPSHAGGNWEWRCDYSAFAAEAGQRLAELARATGRDGGVLGGDEQRDREVGKQFAA